VGLRRSPNENAAVCQSVPGEGLGLLRSPTRGKPARHNRPARHNSPRPHVEGGHVSYSVTRTTPASHRH
ncbi:hypothetical protein C1Y24_29680, partial [Pseudomonas sp. MPR-R2A4]